MTVKSAISPIKCLYKVGITGRKGMIANKFYKISMTNLKNLLI